MNFIFFTGSYAFQAITDAIYVSRDLPLGNLEYIKYGFMFLSVLFYFFQIFFSKLNNKQWIYKYEMIKIILTIVFFLLVTSILSIATGEYSSQAPLLIIKYMLSIIYAFGVLNVFNFEDIYKCMAIILFISIFGYTLEVGIENFTISNLNSISYSNSYSPFESHYFADVSIAMFAFFMYYPDKYKILKYISFIFALFTFKRLTVSFALFLVFSPLFYDFNMKLNKKILFFWKSSFVVATIAYYWLLLPTSSSLFFKLFNQSSNAFTLGRSYRLNQLINSNFTSYGLGSIIDFFGIGLEMELISIFVEMSIIGLIIFVFNYMGIARNNVYCVIYITYVFLNLLTSHSLGNVFGWILIFVITGCINYVKKNQGKLVTKVL